MADLQWYQVIEASYINNDYYEIGEVLKYSGAVGSNLKAITAEEAAIAMSNINISEKSLTRPQGSLAQEDLPDLDWVGDIYPNPVIDDRTPNLNLPLPNPNNQLSDDVVRLRNSISLIDEIGGDGGAERIGFKPSPVNSIRRSVASKLKELTATPFDFGAIGDGNIHTVAEWIGPGKWASSLADVQSKYPHVTAVSDTIDWAATQAAINYVRTLAFGGTVKFPSPGAFVINREIDCFPSVSLELEWETGASVMTTLLGAGAVLFRGTHPTSPSTRGKQLVFNNNYIVFHSSIPYGDTVGCVFIEKRYASDVKFRGNSSFLSHYRNNTAIRLSGLYNCDADPMSVWGAGHNKPWKVSAAARFTIAAGSNSLICDTDVFDSGDVGKSIVVQGSNSQRFTIAAYVDPKTVTVSEAAAFALNGLGGNFEAIRGSVSAASSTLTMEKSCLSAGDVGRVVYILNAKSGFPSPALIPLRATVQSVTSSTQCVLDVQAPISISGTPVIFSPAVELYGEADSSSNDFSFDGLHTEEIRGTNLVVTNAINVALPNLKLHALNNIFSENATNFRAVFAAVSGHVSGDMEGTCSNPYGDIYVSGLSSLLTFDKVTGIMTNGCRLIYAENNSAAGVLSVGDWAINNPNVSAKYLDSAFAMVGSGKIFRPGVTGSYGLDYSQTDYRPRKTVFGARSPVAIGAVTITENPRMDLVGVGGQNPQFSGIAYSGTLEAPASAGDFQTALHCKGIALNQSGSLVDVAGILARVRAGSSSDMYGDLGLFTRASSGYALRWTVDTVGNFVPNGPGVLNLGSATSYVQNTWSRYFRPGSVGSASAPIWTSGSGSPEGVLSATVGSLYTRTDGGAGSTLYVKESGSGATGWVAK